MRPRAWPVPVATLCAGLVLGCAQRPAPPENPDFIWAPTKQHDQGCLAYVKRPRRADVMVDQALWYQRADGSMTADAAECAPPRP